MSNLNKKKERKANLKHLYRPDELAKMYRVSIRSVYRWIASGKVQSSQTPGGRLRVFMSEQNLPPMYSEPNRYEAKIAKPDPTPNHDHSEALDMLKTIRMIRAC